MTEKPPKSPVAIVALTIAIEMIGATICFVIFIFSGVYDIAATTHHIPPVKWVMSTIRTHSIKAHARKTVLPDNFADIKPVDGFSEYDEMCVICHGAPGVARSAIGKGIYPKPPDLEKIADKLKPEEIFWTVSHGLKMAGMPAFSPTHDEASIWKITSLVKNLSAMFPGEYQSLRVQKQRNGGIRQH